MYRRTAVCLAVLLAVVTVVLVPGEGYGGLFDGLCHRTTYAPTFVAPVAAAPACTSCAIPTPPVVVPGCATAAPQLCNMPTVVYRALYTPTVAYRPVAGYTPVATYRPLLGTYETRLVPYTTYYQPAPAVSYATYLAPACPAPTCSPCMPPCPTGCEGGACAAPVTYETPAPACASCVPAVPALPMQPQTPVPSLQQPSTYAQPPAPPAGQTAPQSTYQQQQANRPQTEAERPIPQPQQPQAAPQQQQQQQPSGTLNSMPTPVLSDPNARTAVRSNYSRPQVQFVGRPTSLSVPDADGWQPARD